MTSSMAVTIKVLSPRELEGALATLVERLLECVNEGASLGFASPLERPEALVYWRSLAPQLQNGSRVLLAAYLQDRIIGSGQLALAPQSNARHRATLEKIFVSSALRGRGIGRSIVLALEDAARLRSRSLLLMGARRGDRSEALYKKLGYQEYGIIPGYSLDRDGTRHDNVCLYRELSLQQPVGHA